MHWTKVRGFHPFPIRAPDCYGYDPNDITVLIDDGNPENLLKIQSMKDLVADARSGDQFYLHCLSPAHDICRDVFHLFLGFSFGSWKSVLAILLSQYKITIKEEPQFTGEKFEERKSRRKEIENSICV